MTKQSMSAERASTSDRAILRIERDKARLEEHYQDAMSFLQRADKGGGLVEEQEIESDTVDRLQLKKYESEAMSFLDKAFAGDASVMVEDDNDDNAASANNSSSDFHSATVHKRDDAKLPDTATASRAQGTPSIDESGGMSIRDQFERDLIQTADTSSAVRNEDDVGDDSVGRDMGGASSSTSGMVRPATTKLKSSEDQQIAADRAALERYNEEFGDFLDMAYENEETVMVEDADSETSGAGDGLFGRRMAPSTPSVDSSLNNQAFDEEMSEEVHTDDEFQEVVRSPPPYPSSSADESRDEKSRRGRQNITLDRSDRQGEGHHEDDVSGDADIDDDDDVNVDDDDDSLDRETRERVRLSSTLGNEESRADALPDESNENFHRRMQRYQELVGDIIEEANVSEEEDLDETGYVDQKDSSPATGSKHMSEAMHSEEDFLQKISKNDSFGSSTEPTGKSVNVQSEEERVHLLEKSTKPSNDIVGDEDKDDEPGYHKGKKFIGSIRQSKNMVILEEEERLEMQSQDEQPTIKKTETIELDMVKNLAPTNQRMSQASSAMDNSIDINNDFVIENRDDNPVSHFQDFGAGGRRDGDAPIKLMNIADMRMDLCLEDRSGNSRWRDVQIETSFYRSIPRGATIKLRPKAMQEEWGGQSETGHKQLAPYPQGQTTAVALANPSPMIAAGSMRPYSNEQMVPLSYLKRVENEREVLMATLEEIINERSMLAAQVKEMKSIFPRDSASPQSDNRGHAGHTRGESFSSAGYEDIDLGAELREAYAVMARLNDETDKTLAQMENRNQESLQRAYEAEEETILLKSKIYRLEAENSSQERRLSQATAEQDRLRQLVDGTDSEIKTVRKKYETDIERIEQESKEKHQQDGARIKETQREIEGLRTELTVQRRRETDADSKANRKVIELEEQLKQQQREMTLERSELNEQIKRNEQLVQTLRDEHDSKKSRAESLQVEVDRLNEDVRKWRNEHGRVIDDLGDMERKRANAQRDVEESRRRMVVAETEASELRTRLEESMKQRLATLDEAGEVKQAQATLAALRESSNMKEQALQRQLIEFRNRAERAESAASAAEQDAKEVADMAKLTKERAQAAIQKEQQQRTKLEKEKAVLTFERDQYRKNLDKSSKASADKPSAAASGAGSPSKTGAAASSSSVANESNTSGASSKSPGGIGLGKSSSRRGLRRSSSRNRDAEKKKKEAKAGASGNAGASGSDRKRSGFRAIFYG